MKIDEQTRRAFCADSGRAVCGTALAAALGSILQGCGGGGGGPAGPSGSGSSAGPASSAPALAVLNATAAGGSLTLNVDAGSPLAAVGGAALVQSASGVFLVARTGADAFTALTATCTHEACTINGFANQRFVCPCHGSTFDTNGRVVMGPAVTALRQFTTRFANNVLTITL